MFVSLAVLAAAQILPVTVQLGKTPRQVERVVAPIQTSGPAFAGTCGGSTDWNKAAPPVRIHGNTYLVGTCGVSAVLIAGKQGHILIDGGTEVGADLIARNIRRLGFSLGDVKHLLVSHEHHDHVGAIAKLQRMTGAQLLSSAAAAAVLNSGTASGDDPQSGMNPPFAPAHVDRIVRDGEEVRLGDLVVTAVATPGHTPGAMSWRWGSCDGGVCRQIVYADSLTPVSRDDYKFSAHPDYLAAFRASIAKVGSLNCEILLTPHPAASHLAERLAPGQPLFDPNGCRDYAAALTRQLDERVAKEQAGK